MSILIKALSIF